MEGKYFFNNKDITMNLCIQIRDVIDIINENTLWAESAGYIADRFYEEQEQKELQAI